MALLSSFSLSSTTFRQPQCASGPMASAAATPISRLCVKLIDGSVGPANAVRLCYAHTSKSRSVIVKASAEIDGDTGEKAAVPVENLPLESKLQEKTDAKLRMKLAKKIRIRRKRLVRKRQLRKKGRWPPSKMKKLKNV
uniref:50S ribosomal protein 5, chloroplastic n=1 Tax=Kalanchoe fedtschenkoi TaxID=63787 RepID=A0A7N0V234_KALFE